MQSLMDKAQRHLALAIAFDVAICGLAYGLIVHAWWWGWMLGVVAGLLMWFAVCDDQDLQRVLLVTMPKLALFAMLYGLTFVPVIGDGVRALERWMDSKWPRNLSVEVRDGK